MSCDRPLAFAARLKVRIQDARVARRTPVTPCRGDAMGGRCAPHRAVRRHGRACAAALVLAWPALTQAQPAPSGLEALPLRFVLGIENVELPGGEAMGLIGGTLLFNVGGGWSLGPAVYGAATGQRGGFLVGGIAVQRRFALAPGWDLAAEFYAGGGGGAAAPVGSGLMLRPALTLFRDLTPTLQVGLSASYVSFPSGQIDSGQIGLALAWRSEFLHLRQAGLGGGVGDAASLPSGLGFDRMAALATAYDFRDDSGRRIGLVGARADRRSGIENMRWGLEASAAAQGDAAGYMEILGTVSYSVAPAPAAWPDWRVGARGGLGVGGGGAVPTGGGFLGKLTATSEWRLAPGWTWGAEAGGVASANGGFKALQGQLWLAADLEPDPGDRSGGGGKGVRNEWVGAWLHYQEAARVNGGAGALDLIGLKLNRYLGPNFYVSGQAYSAFAGGAGGFSVGLVGAGLAAAPAEQLRVGAELLVGAAGGGGVQTAGGAVLQGMAWAGFSPVPQHEWRIGVGGVRSFSGALSSPLVELSWTRVFGLR